MSFERGGGLATGWIDELLFTKALRAFTGIAALESCTTRTLSISALKTVYCDKHNFNMSKYETEPL